MRSDALEEKFEIYISVVIEEIVGYGNVDFVVFGVVLDV